MTDRPPVRLLMLSKDPALLTGNGIGDSLERHTYYLERLQEAVPGSEIRIVTFSPGSAPRRSDPVPGLSVYGTRSLHRALYLVDALRLSRQLTTDGWRPSVVTTQGPYEEGNLGLWLARRHKAYFIPQLHFDLFSPEWLKESPLNGFRRMLACSVLKRADRVRVVSPLLKQELVDRLRLAPWHVEVIPVGVTFRASALGSDACKEKVSPRLHGHQCILFVGRFCAAKDLPLWLEVARHILDALPGTRFLMAGDGPEFHEIRDRSRAMDMGDAFLFLGKVPCRDLPEVYAAADLFLLTSRHESFGRVVLEAQLAGVPVVATACAGPADIIVDGKTGRLCPPGDVQALADAVTTLLRDGSLRRSFARSARQRVEEHYGRRKLADDLVRMWSAS